MRRATETILTSPRRVRSTALARVSERTQEVLLLGDQPRRHDAPRRTGDKGPSVVQRQSERNPHSAARVRVSPALGLEKAARLGRPLGWSHPPDWAPQGRSAPPTSMGKQSPVRDTDQMDQPLLPIDGPARGCGRRTADGGSRLISFGDNHDRPPRYSAQGHGVAFSRSMRSTTLRPGPPVMRSPSGSGDGLLLDLRRLCAAHPGVELWLYRPRANRWPRAAMPAHHGMASLADSCSVQETARTERRTRMRALRSAGALDRRVANVWVPETRSLSPESYCCVDRNRTTTPAPLQAGRVCEPNETVDSGPHESTI